MTEQQKKLLGFGGVGLAGVYLFTRMHSGRKTAATPITNTSATGSIAPYTPQSPLTLQPGESVYDPNNEALLTTPPRGASSTPITDQPLEFPGAGTQASAAAAPSYSVNVTYPTTVRTVKRTVKPTKRVVAKKPAKPKKKAAA